MAAAREAGQVVREKSRRAAEAACRAARRRPGRSRSAPSRASASRATTRPTRSWRVSSSLPLLRWRGSAPPSPPRTRASAVRSARDRARRCRAHRPARAAVPSGAPRPPALRGRPPAPARPDRGCPAVRAESESRYSTQRPSLRSVTRPALRSSDRCSETVEAASLTTTVIWQTQSGPLRSIASRRRRTGWPMALWTWTRRASGVVISLSHEISYQPRPRLVKMRLARPGDPPTRSAYRGERSLIE